MITDVPGLRVGHWADPQAQTGCTVILMPEGTVASGEVRGGAPAEREMALLEPARLVNRLDALVLTGGSAFGLAAADGVMRYCEEQGAGVPTAAGPVPIVVALALYDLDVGDPSVRPGPAEGYAACVEARHQDVALGQVGVATGARSDRIAALTEKGHPRPGGLVSGTARQGDLVVSTLVAVNSVGHWLRRDDEALGLAEDVTGQPPPLGSTTIGLVATNACLDKLGCYLLAQSAHDGLARAVFPAHTRYDGDAFVAAAVGALETDLEVVRMLATSVVARAIRSLA